MVAAMVEVMVEVMEVMEVMMQTVLVEPKDIAQLCVLHPEAEEGAEGAGEAQETEEETEDETQIQAVNPKMTLHIASPLRASGMCM